MPRYEMNRKVGDRIKITHLPSGEDFLLEVCGIAKSGDITRVKLASHQPGKSFLLEWCTGQAPRSEVSGEVPDNA